MVTDWFTREGFNCRAIAVFMASSLIFCGVTVEGADPVAGVNEQSGYSHLVFEKLVDDEKGGQSLQITYQRVPGGDPMLSEDQLPRPNERNANILAVSRDAIYFSVRNRFVERMELRPNGQRQFFAANLDQIVLSPKEDFFLTAPSGENVVQRYSIASGRMQVIADRSSARPSLLGGMRIAGAAIAPDGHHVATATYQDGDHLPRFAVEIFDVAALGVAAKISTVLRGELVMTGAGDRAMAPAMLWMDRRTLLVLSPKSAAEADDLVRSLNGTAGETTHTLQQLDLDSQMLTDVMELPLPQFGKPSLWKTVDENGVPQVMINNFQLDLIKGTFKKTERLAGHYYLRGEGHRQSLWFKETELMKEVTPQFVSVSPDGSQIAWFAPVNPRNVLGFASLQSPQVLYHHSESTGVTQLTTGMFSYPMITEWNRSPLANPCLHWVW